MMRLSVSKLLWNLRSYRGAVFILCLDFMIFYNLISLRGLLVFELIKVTYEASDKEGGRTSGGHRRVVASGGRGGAVVGRRRSPRPCARWCSRPRRARLLPPPPFRPSLQTVPSVVDRLSAEEALWERRTAGEDSVLYVLDETGSYQSPPIWRETEIHSDKVGITKDAFDVMCALLSVKAWKSKPNHVVGKLQNRGFISIFNS